MQCFHNMKVNKNQIVSATSSVMTEALETFAASYDFNSEDYIHMFAL